MIGIFTAFKQTPLHPRLEMQLTWFNRRQIPVKVHFEAGKPGKYANWLSLKYFRHDLIRKYKKQMYNFEVVHIYDFRLLPLAKYAKRAGKTVVYETLDDNVPLHFHALVKQLGLLKSLHWLIVPVFTRFEQRWTARYCDRVIVNSPNLLKINPGKAQLIYYASPFEGVSIPAYDKNKQAVFLYLGKLTVSKGADVYAQLSDRFDTAVHFFGQAKDKFSQNWTAISRRVISHGNKSSGQLMEELSALSQTYNLIGLSIIVPENESYALQEANKDIDYMCLGIPFIGNERLPTLKKIEAGAGVLYSDEAAIKDLLSDTNGKYDAIRQRQRELYNTTFSSAQFYDLFSKVYSFLKQ